MDKQNFLKQLKEEERELLDTLRALQILIKRYEGNTSYKHNNFPIGMQSSGELSLSLAALDIPVEDLFEYKNKMILPQRVIFALKILGQGTSNEVGHKMFQIDQSRSIKMCIEDARYYLSKLAGEKKILVKKNVPGTRGNVYMPKPE